MPSRQRIAPTASPVSAAPTQTRSSAPIQSPAHRRPARPDLAEAIQAALPSVSVPASLLNRLHALIPCKALGTDQVLFAEGQVPTAFYLVADGEIEARFLAENGDTSTLERMQAPRLFGLAAFVTQRPARYEAAAVMPSRVWQIPEPAYRLLMDECAGFSRALMLEFARRFEGNLSLLGAARHERAEDRLRLALRQLVRERGHAGAGADAGWQLIHATQTELARSASLSRQTVNALLASAQAQGWIRRQYRLLAVRLDALS